MISGRFINRLFQAICFLAALAVPLVVVGMLATLLAESFPAMERFGVFSFIGSDSWDFADHEYGARRPLSGTLLTTLMAMLAALPVALGTAVFLTELCPEKLRAPIGTALELLSAIPSIIYGMWGLLVLAPFLEMTIQPLAAATLGKLPAIGGFFETRLAGGVNIFTAAMILAVMILPLITSIAREAFAQVSPMLKESSYGLGATRWETVRLVVLPAAKMAVVGGATIAMGRALGEPLAVGNRHASLDSIFSPYVTITSVLANEFNEAGGLKLSVLFFLALALFVANFVVLLISRRLLGGTRWTT